jgi:cytochrome c-type biogenesis protein CcmH/NrfG
MSALQKLLLVGALTLAGSFPAMAETASQAVARADQLWADGKLEQAGKAFEAATLLDPGSVDIRLRQAGFQLSQQQREAAIANYRLVIGKQPNNSKAWIGMGVALLHNSHPAMAREAFAEAIRVDPSRKAQLDPVLARLDEKAR